MNIENGCRLFNSWHISMPRDLLQLGGTSTTWQWNSILRARYKIRISRYLPTVYVLSCVKNMSHNSINFMLISIGIPYVIHMHLIINQHAEESSPCGRIHTIEYKTRIMESSLLKSLFEKLSNRICLKPLMTSLIILNAFTTKQS